MLFNGLDKPLNYSAILIAVIKNGSYMLCLREQIYLSRPFSGVIEIQRHVGRNKLISFTVKVENRRCDSVALTGLVMTDEK